MRIKGLATALFAALFCAVLAVADDEDQPGGDIQGAEQLHQTILLTATTNAPTGAAGKANLDAENEDGTNTATLVVEVEGLLPDTYTISVSRKTDGSTVRLGLFDVTATDEQDALVPSMMGGDAQDGNQTGAEEGLPLPDGLNPMDIASVSVSNSKGLIVLTGDFMTSAETMSGLFKAKVAVTAGPAAPTANGLALVRSKIKQGVRSSRFRLLATGASPNEVLTLKINGFDVGTVTADSYGRIRLNSLPADFDPESLILMEFDDSDGTNAMTISF
ncbi:MAG TPA: hypothetical protein VLZ12_11625 [Verrucomicrobiae bacterium]|nr:hypothetical protein [Verrucomicrobiae bacterium]